MSTMVSRLRSDLRTMLGWTVTASGIVLGIIAGVGGIDSVEESLFPVTGPTQITVTTLQPTKICWQLTFKRYRPKARPEFVSWFITYPKGRRVYLAQEPQKGQFIGGSIDNRPSWRAGTIQRNFCSPLREIPPAGSTIQARGLYKPFHGLYLLNRWIKPTVIAAPTPK